jgi:hypothetical protein
MPLGRQRRDDPPLIRLFLVRCRHGGTFGWPEFSWTLSRAGHEPPCVRAHSGRQGGNRVRPVAAASALPQLPTSVGEVLQDGG